MLNRIDVWLSKSQAILMPCVVCGSSSTVKAHLFPRALLHDLKVDDKHLFGYGMKREGETFFQSGRFDPDILCDIHEQSLHLCDDYAVKFIRRKIPRGKPFKQVALEVPNPQPPSWSNLPVRFYGGMQLQRR